MLSISGNQNLLRCDFYPSSAFQIGYAGFICTQSNNLRVECPAWIGQKLFGHNDEPPSSILTPAVEKNNSRKALYDVLPSSILWFEKKAGKTSIRIDEAAIGSGFRDIDIYGWFQFHTQIYRPYKSLFLSLF